MTTWRRVLCLAAATLQLACAEGYPTEDTGLMLRHDMSIAESVDAMNQLGRNPGLEPQRQYELRPTCVLAIEADGEQNKKGAVSVSLPEGSIAMDKNDERQHYSVTIHPTSNPTGDGVLVLDNTTWSDATQMRWLLDHVRARCLHAKLRP